MNLRGNPNPTINEVLSTNDALNGKTEYKELSSSALWAVKKNVPLRPGHGAIQNNCCWFIGEVADLNQLANYNNTANC